MQAHKGYLRIYLLTYALAYLQVHKGYSHRIQRLYPDVAALVDKYHLPTQTIMTELGQAVNAAEGNYFEVACDWVKKNEQTWSAWLVGPTEPVEWKDRWTLVVLSVVAGLTLIWALLPIICKEPSLYSVWYNASNKLKPTAMIKKLIPCFCSRRPPAPTLALHAEVAQRRRRARRTGASSLTVEEAQRG